MEEISSSKVALVVTSPPYPMIEMWDDIFAKQDPTIHTAFENKDTRAAFEKMHLILDEVWKEVHRILIPGGIACINIGDATRTLNKNFQLFQNHARIVQACNAMGLQSLPGIIWRKPTNSPTKFMGAGMYAPGAYMTLEHEHILIFRKGEKRLFKTQEEKDIRRSSAYFWEERNQWFSDLWELKGTQQVIKNSSTRERSAAYPLELSSRLISMFSVKNDIVVDPFLGTGTTSLSAMMLGRNSIGYDVDLELIKSAQSFEKDDLIKQLNALVDKRISNHKTFVKERKKMKGEDAFKYFNEIHELPVITKQELLLKLEYLKEIKFEENKISCQYMAELNSA